MFEFNVIFVYNMLFFFFFNAVICEQNDIIGQNNVKLCDFIGKTISQLLEGLEPLFLGGYGHK